MARTIPETCSEDASSEAERRVFEVLRTGLGPEYTVIAEFAWLSGGHGRPRDGETDLVIVHPHWGVLAIEVKGGVVASDPIRGWTSNGLGIKDPVKQAREAVYELSRRLRTATLTRSYSYPFGYGVWFPDVDAVRLPPRPDAPDEIVLDASSLEAPDQAIQGLFSYWRTEDNRPGPGTDGVDGMLRLLTPIWALRPLLGPSIRREATKRQRLTEQQFSVLRGLRNRRRALIAGCAGSGKTVLAIEKARGLAEDGSRILFTCFNRNLANAIRETLHDSGVEVATFHDLCYRLGREAGADLPDENVVGMPAAYFAETLPAALDRATSTLGPRYDGIVADEGQDFQDMWWVPLEDLLLHPTRSVLYIFFDDRQDLYGRTRAWPIDDDPFELTVNCRSTQSIHQHLQATLPRRLDEVECIGPPGRSIERIEYESGQGEKDAVRVVVQRLVHDESVDPTDIVILTPRSRSNSRWQDGIGYGKLHLTWATEPHRDEVQVSTIHAFKGLERAVVVLTELGHLYRDREKELLYVGRSRALDHLIELWPTRAPE